MSLIQILKNHIKNLGGWTTRRKILCFAVDDYGNVRLHSPQALKNLKAKDIKLKNRFDHFDALDTREDFEQLFEVLSSVKDQHHNSAIFTPYALSANINFDKVLQDKRKYEYELLPQTYKKLATEVQAYEGAFEMLQEGISNKLIKPQFHGREHLNVGLFEDLLQEKNAALMTNLENKSYTGIPSNPKKPTVSFTQAFAFWDEAEVSRHKKIIEDGLRCFEKVYGYTSKSFTPPSDQLSPSLYNFIEKTGVKAINKARKGFQHKNKGTYINVNNKLGVNQNQKHISLVRNVVFEPTDDRNIYWVDFTFNQIEAAFRTHKPAIVSSHRVNFCGHIDPENRAMGLKALQQLLDKVVKKYPDVEFLSIDELVKEIVNSYAEN